jgi:hypothetical protein
MHETEGRGARARNSNESESVKGRSCTGTMELAKSAEGWTHDPYGMSARYLHTQEL